MCSIRAVNRSIAQQLRDAWDVSKLSLEELRVGAGLAVSVDSISRKLAGKQVLSTDEAEAIAQFLKANIVWTPTSNVA